MPRKRYVVKRRPVVQPSNQSYRLIPLTRGLNAIVDVADFDWLSQWNWCAYLLRSGYYAIRREKETGTTLSMHRQILGCTGPQEQGDHWNHNTLDNRRENLRKCTALENCQNARKRRDNTSGFKGVTWNKHKEKWQAQITHNKKHRFLGYFSTAKEAAKSYDEYATKHFGQFAHVNF